MPIGHMNRLLDQLRRAALNSAGQRLTDGQLVECFITQRDEAAFEALVRRHGPMVLGVCRRVIGNPHDADDAFQATFLVLVRKAASIRPREAVGNWLYGVAHRTALEARGRLARRRAKERQVEVMPQPEVEPDELWRDLQPLLDHELSRLPDKYRLPVVLCDLEGRSRQEVARQLAIPAGTLSSRLATARQTLARRLARHGLAVSGASLAALFGGSGASAGVPAVLLVSTTKAAMLMAAGQAAAAGIVSVKVAALTEGVLKTMLLAKLKTTAVILCGAAAIGLSTGGLLYQTRATASDPSGAGRTRAGVRADQAQAGRPAPGAVGGDSKAEQNEDDPPDARRRADEAARDREQALRDQLDRVRQQAEDQRAQADQQRQKAEAQRQRAEDALRQAKEQLKRAMDAERAARRNAQKAQYAGALQQAQQPFDNTPYVNQRGQRPDRENPLGRFEEEKAVLLKKFDQRRQELMQQLKNLELEQRKVLADLQQRQAVMMREMHPEGAQQPGAADKLDRILERLDQIEQRLQRLETGRRPGTEGRR
ncbi:MAG TPA: sigma-70 family RNA polymerase sigma factor [Gemmataceae bacterium]|nr:sigma-70 family RNA polymerase sigma factor [Gemmataceae bacterium]